MEPEAVDETEASPAVEREKYSLDSELNLVRDAGGPECALAPYSSADHQSCADRTWHAAF